MTEILNQVDALLDELETAAAFELCKDALNNKALSQSQQEILAMQCIRCIIYTIDLEELYSHVDDDDMMHFSQRCENIMNMLEQQVFKLIKYLNRNDHEKIKNMYAQACGYANNRYLYYMPQYVENITDTATSRANTKLLQGHLCLAFWLNLYFLKLAEMACIKNVELEIYHKKPYAAFATKLQEQAHVLIQNVVALAEDFPYFIAEDGVEARKLLLIADHLLKTAVTYMGESDTCDKNMILACQKNRINIRVDQLRMMMVVNGQRGSFIGEPAERKELAGEIRALEAKVRECEPTYTSPSYSVEGTSTVHSGGCYIATAVYGSYDCPEVWTLRRYRDQTLAQTCYGKLFIKVYYAISPVLVKWFGKTNWFRTMWKKRLDTLVEKLSLAGVENTPYNDK